MSTAKPTQDPLEFLKTLWSSMGFPLPGMVAPTLDVAELDRRIAELKAVEGWLKLNIGMLQLSIQGLEMQRATVHAMQTFSQPEAGQPHPFADPGMWPWNFMQPAPQAASDAASGAAPAAGDTDAGEDKSGR